MTDLTDEDITVRENQFNEWYIRIGFGIESKEKLKALKKQILENQKIVQKIRELALDVPMMITYEEFYKITKEVLNQ